MLDLPGGTDLHSSEIKARYEALPIASMFLRAMPSTPIASLLDEGHNFGKNKLAN